MTLGIDDRPFCFNLILITGSENVKPPAERYNQPPVSATLVVATFSVPSFSVTEMLAEIGALVNP